MSFPTNPHILSATVPRTASFWVGKSVGLGTACNELAYTAMCSATPNDSRILLYLITTFILPLCAPSIRNYITADGATYPVPPRPTKSRPKTKGNDGSFGFTTAR